MKRKEPIGEEEKTETFEEQLARYYKMISDKEKLKKEKNNEIKQ